MYKSMFRPEVIRRVELCFFRPCPSLPRTSVIHHVVIPNAKLLSIYTLCDESIGASLSALCWGEPDCNCCLSNKYTYMQLRSPEVTRVNFHLSCHISLFLHPILNISFLILFFCRDL